MAVVGITVFFIVYTLLVIWRPPTILAAMISLFALEQWSQANSSFFASHPRLMNYAFGVLVLLAVAITTIRRGNPFRDFPLVAWLVLGLVGYSWVTTFWSINRAATQEVTRGYLPYIAVNTLLLPLVFRDLKDLRLGVLATIFVGIPMVMLISLGTQLNTGGRSVEFAGSVVDRYGKVLSGGNPLAIAGFAGYLLICCAFFRARGAVRFVSVFRWVVVAFALALIVRSQSRGQFAAVLITVGIMLVLPAVVGIRVRNLLVVAFGGLFFAMVLPWALTFSESETRFDVSTWGSELSNTRVQFCLDLLNYWVNSTSPLNWLFGMGSGTSWHVINNYPHVVPIEVLVELGFFGLFVYSAAIAILAFVSFQMLAKTRKQLELQSLVLVFLGLWTFSSILTLKEGNFLSNYHWMTFSIILAKMSIMVRETMRQRAMDQHTSVKARAAHHRHSLPVATPSAAT